MPADFALCCPCSTANRVICTKYTLLQDLEFDGEDVLGQETGKIELPVYLNSTREDLLFTVDLPVQPVGTFRFYQMVH